MKPLLRWLLTLPVALLIAPATAVATPPTVRAEAAVVRMAELQIDPAQMDSYLRFLREEVEVSVRTEPGVLALNAVVLRGRPGHVRLLEVYASQAAYDAHLASPHFLKYKTGTASVVLSLQLLETDPVLLCTKAGLAVSGEPGCL